LAKVKFEKFTTAIREKIFEITTNYQSLQTLLPEFFPSVRIISIRPNTTLVEEHLKLVGKELIVMAKHVTDEPKTHEIFIVGGDAKGSHIIEEYEQTQEGTRIAVTVDFKLKGSMRLAGIFGKGKVENDFSNIMDKLILIAES
jgi:FlaA1/EpsC-like NDP-sugar epimerase